MQGFGTIPMHDPLKTGTLHEFSLKSLLRQNTSKQNTWFELFGLKEY